MGAFALPVDVMGVTQVYALQTFVLFILFQSWQFSMANRMQVLPEMKLLTEIFCQWLSFTIKESKT
jgi:hypothetical protein